MWVSRESFIRVVASSNLTKQPLIFQLSLAGASGGAMFYPET